MELSLFLAKFFGLYLLVVSALWTFRSNAFEKVIEDFLAQRALFFFSGMVALAAGIAIVLSHSVWEPGWRIVLTLIGYGSVAKGIARMAFPDELREVASRMLRGPGTSVAIVIAFASGAWLVWMGFAGG